MITALACSQPWEFGSLGLPDEDFIVPLVAGETPPNDRFFEGDIRVLSNTGTRATVYASAGDAATTATASKDSPYDEEPALPERKQSRQVLAYLFILTGEDQRIRRDPRVGVLVSAVSKTWVAARRLLCAQNTGS